MEYARKNSFSRGAVFRYGTCGLLVTLRRSDNFAGTGFGSIQQRDIDGSIESKSSIFG